jgi:hypothetical protein
MTTLNNELFQENILNVIADMQARIERLERRAADEESEFLIARDIDSGLEYELFVRQHPTAVAQLRMRPVIRNDEETEEEA